MANPVELVQGLYAAFGRGDVAAILNALADDVTWCVQGPAWLPWFGARRGREQVGQFFQAIGTNLGIQEFTPREFLAQGDRVIVLGYERGCAVPTGRPYQGEWVHVFTVRNGQVTDFREYCDTAAIADAFQGSTRAAA
jgi:ketosteroid isomerase-like protein